MALHLIGGTNSAAGVTIVLNDALSIGANALTCGAITAQGDAEIWSAAAGVYLYFARSGNPTAYIQMYEDGATGTGALRFGTGTAANPVNRFIINSNGTASFGSSVTFEAGLTATSATAGLGYATGAGGTVTQATSKATAFTLSKVTGRITLAGDALAGDTTVSATWTNTAIAATDVVLITHVSGGTLGAYTFNVQAGAGTATLNIRNVTPGSLTETPVLGFVVLKGVTA